MTDTSKEAVEALAAESERMEAIYTQDGVPPPERVGTRAAATLRALVAERDALMAAMDRTNQHLDAQMLKMDAILKGIQEMPRPQR